jgi:putative membrane protein
MKSLLLAVSATALLAAAPAWAQSTGAGGANAVMPNSQGPARSGGAPGTTGPDRSSTNGHAATSDHSASANQADRQFIDHMARDGNAEVEIGKLAAQKASNPEVKSFANRLVQDHSQANSQLMQIAQQEGIQPPKGIGKEHRNLRARLEKLNGAAFDHAFVDAQVKDHQQDIQYVQREQDRLQDPQLKSFAQQTMPVLQQHLQIAQQLNASEGNAAGRSGSTGAAAGAPSRTSSPSR